MKAEKTKETKKQSITVGFLLEANKQRLQLSILTGDIGFTKEIKDKNIHRPGLAMAG